MCQAKAKRLVGPIPADLIFDLIRDARKAFTSTTVFNGHRIRLNTPPLRCFREHGATCRICGASATHAYIEEHDGNAYVAVYAITYGVEVQMTVDHIKPKSKGGSLSGLHNQQPMCQRCNQEKADKECP